MSGYNQNYNGGYNQGNGGYQKGNYQKGNYNNQGGNKKPFGSMYRQNITNTRIMSLWGTNPEGTAASMNIYLSGNTVRMRVYTGMQQDKEMDKKMIEFDFKEERIMDFVGILMYLKDLAQNVPFVPGESKRMAFAITDFVSQSQRGEVGRIIAGRDGDGVFFMYPIDNVHGKVRFNFTFNRDTTVYEVNNEGSEPASPATVSRLFLTAYVDQALAVIGSVLTQEFVDKENKQQGNKPQGGYQKGNNNYQKNYQKNNNYNQGNNYQGNQNNQGGYSQNQGYQQMEPNTTVDELDNFMV